MKNMLESIFFTSHIYMTLAILCRRRHKVAFIAELNLKFSSRFLRQRDACGMVNSVKDKLEIPHCTAVVLAAGSGKRMHSQVAKQFMTVAGKPLIYYALKTVEESDVLTDCILVTGEKDIEYVRQEIVEKYGFSKVKKIVAGGAERYDSVGNALAALEDTRYVFIHDGARPFLTHKILQDTYEAVVQYGACVTAVPSKDTVKISDGDGFARETPDRKTVWNVQTPQVFEAGLIKKAYGLLREKAEELAEKQITVTDDAMVAELFTGAKVKLVEGSYRNIKVTTPEDICVAEAFLKQENGNAQRACAEWRLV